jgi:hypothetical protein
MTVFFTRCCKRIKQAAGALLLLAASLATAGSITPSQASLNPSDDGYVLAAEFVIKLGTRFEDALTHGVPLYFNLEFVLERPRKYWLSEHLVTRTLNYRLTYSSLTRQYRLTTGNLHQNFNSLNDALRVMSRLNGLSVTDRDVIKAGEIYDAAVRLTLDRSQLPKPFQVDAITDRDWSVESTVLRWNFTAQSAP